ncbi:MAG: hypothetical protein IPM82_01620 [Saprospiraceae bacterium]|nr:hypothetical protein [Saprospiraceae bacterium]
MVSQTEDAYCVQTGALQLVGYRTPQPSGNGGELRLTCFQGDGKDLCLYDKARRVLAEHFDDKQLARYNVKRYDSTMKAVFSHLLEGMKVGNTSKKKKQVKITTERQNGFQVVFSCHKDQAHLNEEVALKEPI